MTLSVTPGTTGDTRKFAPYIKNVIGNQSSTLDTAITPIYMSYYLAGDTDQSNEVWTATLPTGLSIDALTGVITGTPTVENASFAASVTLTNDEGSISTAGFTWGVEAAQTLVWEETYTGSEWIRNPSFSNPIPPEYDLDIALNVTSPLGNGESIIAAASRTGAPGDNGQRHYQSGHNGGVNQGTGGLIHYFSSSYPEIWLRWYMRYSLGFAWDAQSYDKWLRLNLQTSTQLTIGMGFGFIGIGFDADGIGYENNGQVTFNSINGGSTGDGQFHLYEVHLKANTPGQSDGVMQMWADEQLTCDVSNKDFQEATWANLYIGSNQSKPSQITPEGYIDFDDFAMSTTGYIGPKV